MTPDQVLEWMCIIAATVAAIPCLGVVALAFYFRKQLDWIYVLFGVRGDSG